MMKIKVDATELCTVSEVSSLITKMKEAGIEISELVISEKLFKIIIQNFHPRGQSLAEKEMFTGDWKFQGIPTEIISDKTPPFLGWPVGFLTQYQIRKICDQRLLSDIMDNGRK